MSFVSRFALLLFGGGGECQVDGNFITLDGFLRFKVGSAGQNFALLVREMRRVIDGMLTESLVGEGWDEEKFGKVMATLTTLLGDE